MDQDPSLDELAWRLNEMHKSMQRLVSQELFTAEQRTSERRFAEVEHAIEALRVRLEEDFRVNTARSEARQWERGSNWRQGVYAGAIPTVLLLISLLVQIWLTVQKNR